MMRRVFIDALASKPCVFFAQAEIVKSYTSDHKDKAQALADAFENLLPLDDIDEVIAVTGPGNFTAIRSGIGFARGLALAKGVPTRGIGTFEIDAYVAGLTAGQIIRDARGGRVYKADITNGMLGEITLCRSEDIAVQNAYSVDVEGAMIIDMPEQERIRAIIQLVENGAGSSPATANYIRTADAAPSSYKPPRIADE